jgi:hypothetical protein
MLFTVLQSSLLQLLEIFNVDFDVTDQLTTHHILCILQILEKKWVYNETVHQLFNDFKKACDGEALSSILREIGVSMKLARQIELCLQCPYRKTFFQ